MEEQTLKLCPFAFVVLLLAGACTPAPTPAPTPTPGSVDRVMASK